MSRVDKRKVQDSEFLSVRNKNNENIVSCYVPHDTTVGASGFKDADLTVLGNLNVGGTIEGVGLSLPQIPHDIRYLVLSGVDVLTGAVILSPGLNISFSDAGSGSTLTLHAVPDGSSGQIQYYNSGVFDATADLRWDVDSSKLDMNSQLKSQNLTSFYRSGSIGSSYYDVDRAQIFMRRVLHFFPANGALSMTGGNGTLQFRNVYGGTAFTTYIGQDHGPGGKPFIVSTTINSTAPGGFYGNTSYSYTRAIRNPVMRAMIRTFSAVSSNTNMTLGFRANNAAGSNTDRPQPFKYAYLQFFTGTNGSSTDSATSVNGSAGSQPIRADTYWTMITSGSSTTQSVNVTGVPVNANTDYYVELSLTRFGKFLVKINGAGTNGSFEMDSGISNTTDLGVEILARPVENSSPSRTRGIGIYFIELED